MSVSIFVFSAPQNPLFEVHLPISYAKISDFGLSVVKFKTSWIQCRGRSVDKWALDEVDVFVTMDR